LLFKLVIRRGYLDPRASSLFLWGLLGSFKAFWAIPGHFGNTMFSTASCRPGPGQVAGSSSPSPWQKVAAGWCKYSPGCHPHSPFRAPSPCQGRALFTSGIAGAVIDVRCNPPALLATAEVWAHGQGYLRELLGWWIRKDAFSGNAVCRKVTCHHCHPKIQCPTKAGPALTQ
jgi:hypothetical protein